MSHCVTQAGQELFEDQASLDLTEIHLSAGNVCHHAQQGHLFKITSLFSCDTDQLKVHTINLSLPLHLSVSRG